MTPLLTCKEFLHELSDYLDENVGCGDPGQVGAAHPGVPQLLGGLRHNQEDHIRIYKGMEPYPIPPEVEDRA